MDRGGKEQQRRERLREYQAQLEAARQPVAVLAEFAKARESRAAEGYLEAEFAAFDGDGQREPLPAAVWVGLRQADLDAVIDILVQAATEQFVIAEHEQLDSGYRLTAIPECRGVPDVDRLIMQVAAFLRVPQDVLSVIAGWGADDPRTRAEIEHLLDQRYGPPTDAVEEPAPRGLLESAPTESPGATAVPEPSPTATELPHLPNRPTPAPETRSAPIGPRARLNLSRAEFAAVLGLTPEQHEVFTVLAREADILICADSADAAR